MGNTRNQLQVYEISDEKFCVRRLGPGGATEGYVGLGQADAASAAMEGTYEWTEGGIMLWKTRQCANRAIKLARWGERYPVHADNIKLEIKQSATEGGSIRHHLCG